MGRSKVMIGEQFGVWTVLKYAGYVPSTQHIKQWKCRCICGTVRNVRQGNLRSGISTNCGCLRTPHSTHNEAGRHQTKEYRTWSAIKTRCTNPNHKDWNSYGGKGVRMHKPWMNSFETFLRDVGRAPSPTHSIDRIDSSKHYAPGNVRWATAKQQGQNTSRNHMITFMGRRLCMSEMARYVELPYDVLKHRLRSGWSILDACTLPPGAKRSETKTTND